MPVSGGGFEQAYNAQAAVATGSLLVVACDVVQAPNDKQQITPMLATLASRADQLGPVDTLLADHHVYLTRDGRLSIAGLAGKDIPYVAAAIAAVLAKKSNA